MLYIVKSCTGEYEDYSESILGYTTNLSQANNLVNLLTAEYSDWEDACVINGNVYEKYYSPAYREDKTIEVHIDYTGVQFKVETLNVLPNCEGIINDN